MCQTKQNVGSVVIHCVFSLLLSPCQSWKGELGCVCRSQISLHLWGLSFSVQDSFCVPSLGVAKMAPTVPRLPFCSLGNLTERVSPSPSFQQKSTGWCSLFLIGREEISGLSLNQSQ